MHTFSILCNFFDFVAVVKGIFFNSCFFISKKVYPGITAATKPSFQKKKKVKSRVRIVKNIGIFLKILHFTVFSQLSENSTPPVTEGGCGR